MSDHYPLVNLDKQLWKDPPWYQWEKSRTQMTIFNSKLLSDLIVSTNINYQWFINMCFHHENYSGCISMHCRIIHTHFNQIPGPQPCVHAFSSRAEEQTRFPRVDEIWHWRAIPWPQTATWKKGHLTGWLGNVARTNMLTRQQHFASIWN